MVPARVFQFNWEGIELGGVRSAWLYLAEKSDYAHSGAHSGAHMVPVGPMSASGADRATCWEHRRCLIRGLQPLAQPRSLMHSVIDDLWFLNLTPAEYQKVASSTT